MELIDSFADIGTSDGNWASYSKDKVQKGNLFHLQQFKQENPAVSIGVSIGGQSHSHSFGQMISCAQSRKQFIDSLVEFLVAFQFDFVDVDFEFPSNGEQAQNLLLFMQELHFSTSKDGMFITMAIPTTAYHLQHFKLEEMQQFVRFFNVMAYGYGEYWRQTVEFNAPLYAEGICIDATVEYLVDKRGISPSKLVLGIPAYCVAFEGCTEMHEVHKGPFGGFGDGGMLDYKELEKHILNASKTEINLKNATAYTVCSENALITHETPETVKEKWEYLHKRGLGGMMVWHIAADSAEKSLFSAIEVEEAEEEEERVANVMLDQSDVVGGTIDVEEERSDAKETKDLVQEGKGDVGETKDLVDAIEHPVQKTHLVQKTLLVEETHLIQETKDCLPTDQDDTLPKDQKDK